MPMNNSVAEAYLVGGVRTPVGPLRRRARRRPARRPRRARRRRARAAHRLDRPANSGASTRSSSAAPTRPARTTATSPAWPPCSPACPTRSPASPSTGSAPRAVAPSSWPPDDQVRRRRPRHRRRRRVHEPRALGAGEARQGLRRPGAAFDTSIGWRFAEPASSLARDKATYSMPETAEEVARVDGITREDADAFALRSQPAARAGGHRRRPLRGRDRRRADPQGRGRSSTRGRRPGPRWRCSPGCGRSCTGGSVVTAGNSSALNDGASAILVACAAAVERLGLTPRARVVVGASAGSRPRSWASAPSPPPRRCSNAPASTSTTSAPSSSTRRSPPSRSRACAGSGSTPRRVNGDGGAIALGHPLGSSRLATRRHPARPHGARGRRATASPPCASASARAPRICWSACDGGRTGPDPAASARCWSRSATTAWSRRSTAPRCATRSTRPRSTSCTPLCAELESDPRILILTGAGGVFASGADIAQLRERRARRRPAGHQLARSSSAIAELPMPVIAALDGYASAAAPSSRTPPTSGSAPRACGSATPRPGSASSPPPAPAGASGDRGRGARERAAAHRPC